MIDLKPSTEVSLGWWLIVSLRHDLGLREGKL